MILYIGQLYPITVYRTIFWVRAVLVLGAIMRSFYYFLDRILFHHDFHHDSIMDLMAILFILKYTFRLSVTK